MSGDKSTSEASVQSSEENRQPSAQSSIAPEKSTAIPAPSDAKDKDETRNSSNTSLFGTLLSPFNSLLKISPDQSNTQESGLDQKTHQIEQSKTPTEPETTQTEPEPYYTPNEVPLFKKLQKKRLTGTRTKQLLRAAARAHDDPPPPPELGTCCGSSCDPCVNDLWREERNVWMERWGDRAVKDGSERKDLDW
ncbi:hypothetical protein VI817_004858 [Penicillium citrinum]|nr:hypothetical protein VI817_004858 [Penicillium citrinum]